MAITNKVLEFTLELTPGGIPPIIHASQGDVGRTFKANVVWNGSAASAYISGTTVKLRGKKPDKTVFDYSATLSGSAVTFSTTEQMTIISGPVECELVFYEESNIVASANFILVVEESPFDPNAISESEIDGLNAMIQAATPEAVADWFENDAPTSTTFANAVNAATDTYLDEHGVDLSEYALQSDLDELSQVVEDAITTQEYTETTEQHITPTFTSGIINVAGTYSESTTMNYSQKISVTAGDRITATDDGTLRGLRWVCAYNGDTVVQSASSQADNREYVVPDGIDGVVITVRVANAVDSININSVNTLTASYANITPMGYTTTKGTLSNGQLLELPYQNVKINNCYIFNANITTFSSITFYKAGTYSIKVDADNITVINDVGTTVIPHGLTITHDITLVIENTTTTYTSLIRVSSAGAVFDHTEPVRFIMDGNHPRVMANGSTLTDCTLSWVSKNVNCPIWLFGDSYISWYPERWSYYLAQDGYTKTSMLNGYAGQASDTAYNALVNLLAITTPKMVVWCLGMNNGDTSTAVNSDWLKYYEKVTQLSKKYGFELVLYTTPTTPTINNNYKNAIVRSSGYRYIEADKAVRINDNGEWVTGALSSDNVHPTEVGAKILYNRFLADLPELMCNR